MPIERSTGGTSLIDVLDRVLDKGIVIAEASVGKGRVFLFGNELLFRSQPHGNFKLFFNALYLSVAPEMK